MAGSNMVWYNLYFQTDNKCTNLITTICQEIFLPVKLISLTNKAQNGRTAAMYSFCDGTNIQQLDHLV